MVVPLATGVSENDEYQRACERRETPLQGTDSFGSLPTLTLSGTRVTDAGLVHLAGLKSLAHLTVRGAGVTEAGVAALLQARPRVRVIR
jgi:hypothetical protein